MLMLTTFFGLRWVERMVTFHPSPWDAAKQWSLPAGTEEVWIKTHDGLRLNGWYFHEATGEPTATVLFFHGNGGNVSHLEWLGKQLQHRRFDVLLFDYRGYGRSDGEIGDESSFYSDADAALAFLNQRGVDTSTVVFYGQSLGTAAATDIASRHKPAALILESGFTSSSDLASTVLPWFPRALHRLGRYRFESLRKLGSVRCPVLISHGDPDHTIPTTHGHALFAAAHEPKKLLIVSDAGHNVFGSAGEAYFDNLAAFIISARRRSLAVHPVNPVVGFYSITENFADGVSVSPETLSLIRIVSSYSPGSNLVLSISLESISRSAEPPVLAQSSFSFLSSRPLLDKAYSTLTVGRKLVWSMPAL